MPNFPITNGIETFSKPPDGYVVDFDHPRRQLVLEHYLVFAIGGPLALLAMMQRFYTKVWLANGFEADDVLMLLGWIAALITQVMIIDSIVEGGFCAHSWEMPLERFETYTVVAYVAPPMFMLCNGFSKLSLLTVYLQLSPQKLFRASVWASIIFVATGTATITFTLFVHCAPIRKAYDVRLDGGTCLDASILYMSNAAVNIITDILLFILPIPMIFHLRMGMAQKLGALMMLSVGSLTIATSIVKLVLLPVLLKTTDFSWESAPANLWSFVEANLFIICGSMPTLRKFSQHMSSKWRLSDAYKKPYLIHLSDPSERSRQAPTGETSVMSPGRLYHEQLVGGLRAQECFLYFEEMVLSPEILGTAAPVTP